MTSVLFILAYLAAGVLVTSLSVRLVRKTYQADDVFLLVLLWPLVLVGVLIVIVVFAVCKAVEAITGESIDFGGWQ